ncbi:Mobile element protein [uncultured Microcoleus sp.]|uniref:Mobile element protein n=1 Tax=uncultured Microcoleus sp. TaxID=259945 RepID=A0A6J4NTL4_9CYAN|nr:Mobile element protein [uncultured Microcoleus sp.]
MEDVLELYEEEFHALRPVVCFDETSKQLVRELRVAVPAKGGQVKRFDYEYKRNGVANLFMMCQPKSGWRHVEVTDRHTKMDFAEQMKYLVDEAFPEAEKIRVVMDNLSTHSRGAIYDRFTPSEASRILRKLEFHFTPKHASWLNMAEIELSILARQCLSRRIADKEVLKSEVKAWEEKRNQAKNQIQWKMTVDTARKKLSRHYPSILE